MLVPESKHGRMGFPTIDDDAAKASGSADEPPPPTYEEALTTTTANLSLSGAPFSDRTPTDASSGRMTAQPDQSSSAIQRNPSFYAPSTRSSDQERARMSVMTRATSSAGSSSMHGSVYGYKGKSPSSPVETVLEPPPEPLGTPESSRSPVSRAVSTSSRSPHPDSKSKALLALPRPESFDRPPPTNLPYPPFSPAVLHARGVDIARDGFPLEPPSCACAPDPHPFVTHDVNEDDWHRFLQDVQSAGGLTPVNAFVAEAAPVAVTGGLFGVGIITDLALRAHLNSKRKSPVANVIEDWNRRFFRPRLLNVVLAQGTMTYSGPPDMPPADLASRAKGKGAAREGHVAEYEDVEDDNWNGPNPMGLGRALSARGAIMDKRERKAVRKAERRERKAERHEGRRGRIEFSKELRASVGEAWRLIVAYNPPVL